MGTSSSATDSEKSLVFIKLGSGAVAGAYAKWPLGGSQATNGFSTSPGAELEGE